MEVTKKNKIESKSEKDTKNDLGDIEAIASELTSAKLKQAIIMAEIIGKPLSKRKGRRNR